MKLSKYEVFLKIIELGSLSRAADFCNYSQSAVSQIVLSLENELGMALLNRNHAGVWLTSDGEQLLPYIRNLSRAHVELAEKASELLNVESGLIRIGTFSSISCRLLAPVLKDFKVLHPNIKFELYQGDYKKIETWISDGSVDFGFVDLPTLKEFETMPICDDRMMALMPADHEYAEAEFVPLELFDREPVILLKEGTRKEVLEMFHKQRLKPKIEYMTEDDYTIMSMVENGLGISILGEMVLQKISYNIVIKETSPRFSRKIGVAIKNRRQASIAVRCFLDYIEENAGHYLPPQSSLSAGAP